MDVVALPPTLLDLLNELFTRTFIGAGTYVFESQPYAVAEDADLLEQLRAIKEQDRDHATLLAGLLRSHGHVPEPGVFPYWHRDVNYLTVPFMAGFVAESLQTDLDVLARAQVRAPAALEDVHATLQVIGAEREALLAALAPAAVAAKQREAEAYAAASRALREAREARLAAEKAAEAARKEAERAK
ncbi:MAG: hypothetical protein P1V36_12020, partial [Planctomycetota bacterium]|nr:hypothetical protein [Planctomycetota bacterium]